MRKSCCPLHRAVPARPSYHPQEGIGRHHLFPKGCLKSVLGISDTKRVNQIANFALVDWVENIAISDLAHG